MRTAIQPDNRLQLPTQVLKRLGWKPGRSVYVYPLDDGVALRARPSKVLEAAQAFEEVMQEEKVTLADLLKE